MFKGKIAIKYVSDWSIDLVNKFKCNLEVIYCQNIDKHHVIDVMKITNLNSKYSFKDIKEFLEKYNIVEEVECIDEKELYILIKISMIMEGLTNNQHFVKNFCFQIGTIKFEDNYEIWTFFSPKKEYIKNLIKELNDNKDREVKLLSITQYSLQSQDLTQKQFFYYEYLHRKGYFEIPKQITLEQAANDLNTTPTNINKHVNRAVKKLSDQFFGN